MSKYLKKIMKKVRGVTPGFEKNASRLLASTTTTAATTTTNVSKSPFRTS